MPHRAIVPSVNPLFYEALRGDFTSPTDPGAVHTLGDLLIETFQRGGSENAGFGNAGVMPFWKIHPLDWAPGHRVEITGNTARGLGHIGFICVGRGDSGNNHANRLSIWDCSVAAEPSSQIAVRLPGGEDIIHLPAEHGEGLAETRLYVAEAAALVFN